MRRFDIDNQNLTLPSGRVVTSNCLFEIEDTKDPTSPMTKLIFQLASSVGRLEPDDVETSLMAALLLFYPGKTREIPNFTITIPKIRFSQIFSKIIKFQNCNNFPFSDRPGLEKSAIIERAQDEMLSALKHYVSDTFPGETIRWPKLLMKLTDIRATGARLYEYLSKKENTIYLAELFGDSHVSR